MLTLCNYIFTMPEAEVMYHFGKPFQAYLLLDEKLGQEGMKNIKPAKGW